MPVPYAQAKLCRSRAASGHKPTILHACARMDATPAAVAAVAAGHRPHPALALALNSTSPSLLWLLWLLATAAGAHPSTPSSFPRPHPHPLALARLHLTLPTHLHPHPHPGHRRRLVPSLNARPSRPPTRQRPHRRRCTNPHPHPHPQPHPHPHPRRPHRDGAAACPPVRALWSAPPPPPPHPTLTPVRPSCAALLACALCFCFRSTCSPTRRTTSSPLLDATAPERPRARLLAWLRGQGGAAHGRGSCLLTTLSTAPGMLLKRVMRRGGRARTVARPMADSGGDEPHPLILETTSGGGGGRLV